jgi:hypothetical protein
MQIACPLRQPSGSVKWQTGQISIACPCSALLASSIGGGGPS